MGYLATGVSPGPMGSSLGSIAPYRAFATSDGHVMIAAGNDAIFRRLCRALALDDLASDERFSSNADRVAHRDVLDALVTAKTQEMRTEELLSLAKEHAVPASAIHGIAEVVDDPQVSAAGMLHRDPHHRAPDYRDVALPLRLNGRRPRGETPPPAAGADTVAVLSELGYSEEEITALIDGGAVSTSADATETAGK
jgi:crotonobetainyl-CoA:carnitine CoA-transferase CaiB-like acyl-CoA transferase